MTNEELKERWIERTQNNLFLNGTHFEKYLFLLSWTIFILSWATNFIYPTILSGIVFISLLCTILTSNKAAEFYLEHIDETFKQAADLNVLTSLKQSLEFWNKVTRVLLFTSLGLFALCLLLFMIELLT